MVEIGGLESYTEDSVSWILPASDKVQFSKDGENWEMMNTRIPGRDAPKSCHCQVAIGEEQIFIAGGYSNGGLGDLSSG